MRETRPAETVTRGEEFSPVFWLRYSRTRQWEKFEMPEGTEGLMNNGDAKNAIFGFFRSVATSGECDAVAFAADTWTNEITEEGKAHWEETLALAKKNQTEALIRKGWASRYEAIVIVAQNEASVLILKLPYRRTGSAVQLLPQKQDWVPQAEFSGRGKMFGDLRPENLGEETDA